MSLAPGICTFVFLVLNPPLSCDQCWLSDESKPGGRETSWQLPADMWMSPTEIRSTQTQWPQPQTPIPSCSTPKLVSVPTSYLYSFIQNTLHWFFYLPNSYISFKTHHKCLLFGDAFSCPFADSFTLSVTIAPSASLSSRSLTRLWIPGEQNQAWFTFLTLGWERRVWNKRYMLTKWLTNLSQKFPSEQVRKVRLKKVKAKTTQLVSDRTRIWIYIFILLVHPSPKDGPKPPLKGKGMLRLTSMNSWKQQM